MRSNNVVTSSLPAIVSLLAIGCAVASPVRDYLSSQGLNYPFHSAQPNGVGSTVVCPGCEVPERPLSEGEQRMLADGRQFATDGRLRITLREIVPEAEAVRVSGVYLFEDPPGAEIGLAVNVAVFEVSGRTREIYQPHDLHSTKAGDVMEVRNILVLKRTGQGWEYRGWVY